MRREFHVRFWEGEGVRFPSATRLVVLGKAPSAQMRAAVETLVVRVKLTVNAEKTRCCRLPEEPIEFLGYRIGQNFRPKTGRAYIGTRPSKASVQSICRTVSELTAARYGAMDHEVMVERLNRAMHGWANYFAGGQVRPAYRAIDQHASRRLRQWLCRKHKVRSGIFVRFPVKRLWDDMGLTRLALRTASLPWAKA